MDGFKHCRGQWGLPGGSAVKNLLALKEMQETWVQSLGCNSMDRSLSNSSVHGIFQARILEWIAILFSR